MYVFNTDSVGSGMIMLVALFQMYPALNGC
jgi:hypothetical protein